LSEAREKGKKVPPAPKSWELLGAN
jgi:hypothetical protein